ncbi:piggyBac transposable element-derived protein 4-like isoform X1 [Anguilla anguilla]|uniref:piggyBac transposable element-derived protein 4-like isoform X1 n=1 Tax=Anguilla anguilla TaxID=7936 RepID=UPI0015AA0A60|nr:piggyBac transposable element-derived protein 4-like isoform X1 [Anguilla anguilla]
MENGVRKSERKTKNVRYFESNKSDSNTESDNVSDLESDDSDLDATYEDSLEPQPDFVDAEGSETSCMSPPVTPVKRGRLTPLVSPRPSKGHASRFKHRRRSSATGHEEGRWNSITDPDVEPQVPRFCPARKPGVQLDTTKDYSHLELFQLFFDHSVVKTLCKNTNKNAERVRILGRKCPWVPLTVPECYRFLGLLIFMGLLKVSALKDYWALHRIYSLPFCRTVMTRKRFEVIMWTLHMSDPEEDEENKKKRGTPDYDRLFYLRPLLDSVVLSCKAFYHPRQNLSIDERMVGTRAKNMLKQHMKSKPIKWGFKLFVLADAYNGYTCNFSIYQGRSGPESGKGIGYNSVMNLINLAQLGTGYHLYVDSFYTSTRLFRDLYCLKIGACGTINENRQGFPRARENALSAKSDRGEIRWIRDKELLFVKWKDTRQVAMCTTIHKVYTGEQTLRRILAPGGKWTANSVPIPTAVRAYNQHMGGVDLSDALIKYYSVAHKTKKWYKTLFLHFVDIAVVNAFLLHKDLAETQKTTPLSQKVFREQLCLQLVDFGEDGPAPAQAPEQSLPVKAKRAKEKKVQKSCIPVCITEGQDIHYSLKATKGRKYCVLCSKEKNGLQTIWKCEACNVALCLIPDRNCFRDWHSLLAKEAKKQEMAERIPHCSKK